MFTSRLDERLDTDPAGGNTETGAVIAVRWRGSMADRQRNGLLIASLGPHTHTFTERLVGLKPLEGT